MIERIKKVIIHALGISEIYDGISQQNCEKWDSLRHLNLVMELELEFDISIEPEEIAVMRSLQDIIRIVGVKTV